MNISILFRGPIRPDYDTSKKCIENLKMQLIGQNVETYMLTWEGYESEKMQHSINNLSIVKEPSDKECLSKITNRYSQPRDEKDKWMDEQIAKNSYKMFWSTREVIRTAIKKHEEKPVDMFILSRPDVMVDLLDVNSWLTNDWTYKVPSQNRHPNLTDNFAVAHPDVMKRCWDYQDEKHLNDLVGQSWNPESCLEKIIAENGDRISHKHVSKYHLMREGGFIDKLRGPAAFVKI